MKFLSALLFVSFFTTAFAQLPDLTPASADSKERAQVLRDTTLPPADINAYDLVGISKHILGLKLLGSPYKIIAADVNKSQSISTIDLVETRKLVLGIHQDFPNNKPWRFVSASHVFPQPANPFVGPLFPEGIINLDFPVPCLDFIAIKTGDVNNSAALKNSTEQPQTFVSWPALKPEKGAVITMPVMYTGAQALDAIQLGLQFDTSKLQLIGPSMGDMESFNQACFNLMEMQQGKLRALWFPLTNPLEKIQPGQVLFYLSFKVLGDLNGDFPLHLSDKLLECLAWNEAGATHTLANQTMASTPVKSPSSSGLKATVFPNPASSDMAVELETKTVAPLRIALFDAFGHQVAFREEMTTAGRQIIRVPELSDQPAGVYLWKVYTKVAEAQGTIIKL